MTPLGYVLSLEFAERIHQLVQASFAFMGYVLSEDFCNNWMNRHSLGFENIGLLNCRIRTIIKHKTNSVGSSGFQFYSGRTR